MSLNPYRILAVSLVLAFTVSCGKKDKGPEYPKPPPPPPSCPEPQWVSTPIKGCAAQSVDNRGIEGLVREAAEGRAKKGLAGQIKTYITGQLKDYIAQGLADKNSWTEERITSTARHVVDQAAVGFRTVKTKKMCKQIYALVCLDTQTFVNAIEKMNEADEKMRTYVRKRAEKEFKDLDEQVKKVRGR